MNTKRDKAADSLHSPGEWTVKAVYPRIEINTTVGDETRLVAHAFGLYDDEQEANAHLMAAAPELLKACKLALGQLEGVKAKSGCHAGSLKADIAILRAAIAKAGGAR